MTWVKGDTWHRVKSRGSIAGYPGVVSFSVCDLNLGAPPVNDLPEDAEVCATCKALVDAARESETLPGPPGAPANDADNANDPKEPA